MKFYRVKKEYDNFDRSDGSILVKNEIYTEKEVERYSIPRERLVECEVSKFETYWFFGARFSFDCGHSN